MIETGKKAPEFCLPEGSGKEVCLKDFAGKWVVLYFYPKDNTSGWTTEALEFSGLKSKFARRHAVVLGVSPDSVESHKKFIEKKGITITLLSDRDHSVLEAYGAWGRKKIAGKEKTGVIRSTVLIDPEGVVTHVWPKVKAKGHAEQVLEVLIQRIKEKD